MTSRRDFLASLVRGAAAIAVVGPSALAAVQRLGTVQEWVPPASGRLYVRKYIGELEMTADVYQRLHATSAQEELVEAQGFINWTQSAMRDFNQRIREETDAMLLGGAPATFFRATLSPPAPPRVARFAKRWRA